MGENANNNGEKITIILEKILAYFCVQEANKILQKIYS